MRMSSRSRGSKSTRSSSLVAALSRWLSAREKAAAWPSKSRRTATGNRPAVSCLSSSWRQGTRSAAHRVRSTCMGKIVGHFRPRPARRPDRTGVRVGLESALARGRAAPGGWAPERGCRLRARSPAICSLAAQHRRRRLRPARRRGLARRPAGLGHAGRRAGARGRRPRRRRPRQRRARLRYDLRPGSPDLSAFPRAAWLAAARRALATAPFEALGYGDPARAPGAPRAALADYLGRARGVRATADRIVICSGFAQALGAAVPGAACARRDARVAIEALRPDRPTVTPSSPAGLQRSPAARRRDGAVIDGLGGRRRGAAHAGAPVPARHGARPARGGPAVSRVGGRPRRRSSSRTTTTGSSATTASRWARCRRWRPSTSSTPAPPARPWRPGCGWAGSSLPARPRRRRRRGRRRWPTGRPASLDQLTLAELIAVRRLRPARAPARGLPTGDAATG